MTGEERTVWLLKVSITFWAPSLLSNTISAITIGRCLMMRQLSMMPPTGVMALSMSAAVVPGAKFWAITTYGPASPRIWKPWFLLKLVAAGPVGAVGGAPLGEGVESFFCWVLLLGGCCSSERIRAWASFAACRFCRLRLAAGGMKALGSVMREARGPRAGVLVLTWTLPVLWRRRFLSLFCAELLGQWMAADETGRHPTTVCGPTFFTPARLERGPGPALCRRSFPKILAASSSAFLRSRAIARRRVQWSVFVVPWRDGMQQGRGVASKRTCVDDLLELSRDFGSAPVVCCRCRHRANSRSS